MYGLPIKQEKYPTIEWCVTITDCISKTMKRTNALIHAAASAVIDVYALVYTKPSTFFFCRSLEYFRGKLNVSVFYNVKLEEGWIYFMYIVLKVCLFTSTHANTVWKHYKTLFHTINVYHLSIFISGLSCACKASQKTTKNKNKQKQTAFVWGKHPPQDVRVTG